MKKMNNKGFSLVELIVVIAIMVVLMGVLAPTFSKFIERGKKSTDCSNFDAIKSSLTTYYSDPNVADTDQLKGGEVLTLSPNTDIVVSSDTNSNVAKALKDSKIGGDTGLAIRLKSSKWSTDEGKVKIIVTIDANGGIVITSSGEKAEHKLCEGKYK